MEKGKCYCLRLAAPPRLTDAGARTLMQECLRWIQHSRHCCLRPLLHRFTSHSHLSPHRAGFFRRLASAQKIQLLLPSEDYHQHNLYSGTSSQISLRPTPERIHDVWARRRSKPTRRPWLKRWQRWRSRTRTWWLYPRQARSQHKGFQAREGQRDRGAEGRKEVIQLMEAPPG